MRLVDRPASTRWPRPARWLAPIVALLMALGICEALEWRFLRAPLQSALASRLGVDVRLDAPFRARLLRPPRVELAGLHVGAPPASGAPFLADARGMRLTWRWRDLASLRTGERLRVRGLEAESLEAHLRRSADGRASWQFEPPDPERAKAPLRLPEFGVLAVRSGRLHIDDLPLQLRLEATLGVHEASRPRPAAGAAEAKPGVELAARGTFRGQPVEAELRAAGLADAVGGDAPGRVDAVVHISVGPARVAFDGALDDLFGTRGVDGRLAVSGPSLAAVGEPFGVTLPTTPPFALHGALQRSGDVWSAKIEAARIGSSRLRGEFRYDATPNVPRLSGSLSGARLAIADLAPAVGASSDAETAADASRALPAREFDLPSLQAMDADVRVALDELDLNTRALATLKPLKARVRVDRGVLTLDDIDARTAGGRVRGRTRLDGTADPALWRADLALDDIDLAGWLNVARTGKSEVDARSSRARLARERARAKSTDEPVRSYVTGVLRAELQLAGRGRSTAAILGSLDGHARATVRDGTVSHLGLEVLGLDLAQALGMLVKGDESLPLHCAVVALQARRGELRTDVAVFDTRDTTVTLDGGVNLRDETLALRAVALPRDFTVLSLRTPVRFEGTFTHPQVVPETAPLARRVLAGIALGLLNPLAALLPFVDPGDPQAGGCRTLVERQRSRHVAGDASPVSKETR